MARTGRSVVAASTLAGPGAICLAGHRRLRELLPLLRFARALRVYGPPVARGERSTASVWQLDLHGMRLTLILSPEVARGFSGEGAALAALAGDGVLDDAELVAASIAFDAQIDTGRLAEATGLSPDRVRRALTQLAVAGRVGYDHADAAFFHRELPYHAGASLRANPRLQAAHGLLAAGAVEWVGSAATVRVADHVQRVRDQGGALSCSCSWWAEYRGGRGPCKHILAAQLHRRGAEVSV
jgi:hypothetical protein